MPAYRPLTKALQGGIAVDIVAAGLHQTDLIVDVISQLGAPLDAETLPCSVWTALLIMSIICLVLPVP